MGAKQTRSFTLYKLGGTTVSSNPQLFCAYSWFQHIHGFRRGEITISVRCDEICCIIFIERVVSTLWRNNISY